MPSLKDGNQSSMHEASDLDPICRNANFGRHENLAKLDLFQPFLATFVSCSSDDYPLSTYVVSGAELGAHGAPYVHEHNGNIVKFCCKPCLDDFNEDPVKFLAKLER